MRAKLWNDTYRVTRPNFPTMGTMLKEQLGSNDPVESQGPSGTLTGEGVRVIDDGDTVIFTGKSKMILYPDEKGPLQ